MPKGAYIGINNVARTIKNGYVGVDGIARRIKKAYIGMGGVARPCWSSGELVYYGTVINFSASRADFAATHVGDYALFGGGLQTDSWSTQQTLSSVDAISSSLIHSYPQNSLSVSRMRLSATHVGDYALFGGGCITSRYASIDAMSNIMDAFNISLSKSNPPSLSFKGQYISATHVGDYALFGGGFNIEKYTNIVSVYHKSLTKQSDKLLSKDVVCASTHVGDYAIFAGGYNASGPYSDVDTYDKSLIHSKVSDLSVPRSYLSATHVGDYAIFAGGCNATFNKVNVVDVYDKNKIKIGTVENLTYVPSISDFKVPAASVDNSFALFNLGQQYDSHTGNSIYVIDIYDASLTKTHMFGVSFGYVNTHVGHYTLACEGSTVNAFTIM